MTIIFAYVIAIALEKPTWGHPKHLKGRLGEHSRAAIFRCPGRGLYPYKPSISEPRCPRSALQSLCVHLTRLKMLGLAVNRQPGFRRGTRRAKQRRKEQSWLAGWLSDWLAAWLAGCLAGFPGCLADCLAGCLPGWLPGWLPAWLAGSLPVRLPAWLAVWLAAWLPGWLPNWPAG